MRAYYRSLKPFILWREQARPLNWAQVFGRIAPLELEIGFGNGDYLAARAQQHPEHDFVGIELEWEGVQRALRKIAGAGLTNVRILLGDARPILGRAIPLQSLTRVYALFPCPWPKKHHHKHRLFDQQQLQLINSRLQPNGEFYLLTDHEEYFQWVLGNLTDTGFLAYARTVPPQVNTKYEQKWRAAGQTRFYELTLTKIQHCEIPLREDVPMETHRVKSFDLERFQPIDIHEEVHVVFKETRYDPVRQIAMTRVVVVEDDLTQHFWIEIAWEGSQWRIRPAPGCGVVPTVGVQRALDAVRAACDAD
ncbi:MAG: tRNA (guanosine(46)-N7)-methyltransferase TrmB [Armatimonadetes bacterium JP3_11]|nr:MAG: tRNA (guanosine(46)-N7)-methyltransferase TrmB [Armatimonadetes bacterium CP1_7O]OYT75702.1 MAG: tRNA (guanosine(46)-N7)-methyltransferase TrmB [Armatimonadetes bacterium JP3_11]RMH08852.1 MAG: tRNA (guanosine(46)-N7)-methyltransferase TrmB [Armatimonadota bacterium]